MMKIKSFFCILILSLFCFQAFPQSYDSLVVENAQWLVIWNDDETPWEDEMSISVDFIEGIGHAQGLLESPVINVSSMDTWYLSDYCRGTDEECGVAYVKVDEYQEKDSFSIFPNPADKTIRLHFLDIEFHFLKEMKLAINDVYGRMVKEVSGLANDYTIDVSDFPNGIYFVRFIDNNKVIASQKLIISR